MSNLRPDLDWGTVPPESEPKPDSPTVVSADARRFYARGYIVLHDLIADHWPESPGPVETGIAIQAALETLVRELENDD